MHDNEGPDTARTVGRWMAVGAWVIVLGLCTVVAQRALESRAQARAPRTLASADGRPLLELRADRRGHYSIVGEVNGESVEFLLDTGATGIALPGELAERLGLPRGRAFPVSTAAGPSTGFTTRLDSLQIGPFARSDVAAGISPAMQGEVALLGMSFLADFELLQRDGRLTIREP